MSAPIPTDDGARLRGALLALLLLASAGCPELRGEETPPVLPYWSVRRDVPRSFACADVDLWIAKSGKTGLGVTVAFSTRAPGCNVAVRAATLTVGSLRVLPSVFPSPLRLTARPQHAYLAFLFDNDAAWRRGERTGELTIALSVDGAPVALMIPLWQTFAEPHRTVVTRYPSDLGCARLSLDVLGKQSDAIGLLVRLDPTTAGCAARVIAARLLPQEPSDEVQLSPLSGQSLPASWTVLFRRAGDVYLGRGGTRAELELSTADGVVRVIRFEMFEAQRRSPPP